ncbi:hypothetical protein HZB02_06930 [Candidatus Woesearchaeota archaeon]|nr:hypothetical protein [Candidatus Woesearchaeota archaeon]
MILVVDLCAKKDSLAAEEFVRPVVELLGESCVVHMTEVTEQLVEQSEGVVLCGVQLQDFDYLDHVDRFAWLKTTTKRVLGICAGAQVIAKVFGGNIVQQQEIGVLEVLWKDGKTEQVYTLHNNAFRCPKGFIVRAKSEQCIHAVQKKTLMCVLFHPEVLNKEMVKRYFY